MTEDRERVEFEKCSAKWSCGEMSLWDVWEAARCEERKRTAQLLCNVSQILNVVKQEWGESWSEWDESVASEVRKWQAEALREELEIKP